MSRKCIQYINNIELKINHIFNYYKHNNNMFPIFQRIFDYKLANVKKDEIILHIQNIALFGISIYSLYSCVNYYVITGQTMNILIDIERPDCTIPSNACSIIQNEYVAALQPFHNLLFFIKIHAIIDIFLVKTTDVFLHHLFLIGMSFYTWYTDMDSYHIFMFSYSLIKTEVSSIFFILKYWLPEKTYAYNINGVIFYVFFLKFRIFDVYNEIIRGNYIFDTVINKYTPSNPLLSGLLYVSIYGLYILNAYWFLIMTKIIYKQVCKNTFIDTDKMCHYICSYIHYLNIPLAAYMYSYNKHERNIYDMSGIVMLSIASYMFHYDIYEKIHTKQIIEYVVEKNINYVYFLNDCLCIHIRSFLAVFTKYYNTSYFYAATTLCGVFQFGCFYNGVINVVELLSNKTYDKSNFLKIHYVFTFLPVGIDILAIYLNTKSQQIAIPFLFVNIWIVLLFIVDPFYKLTHVAFHLLLFAQSYYMCLTNSST